MLVRISQRGIHRQADRALVVRFCARKVAGGKTEPAVVGLQMHRVTDPETIRQVCIYWSTARSLPPAAEAFRDFVVERLRSLDFHPSA